jgi:protease IV
MEQKTFLRTTAEAFMRSGVVVFTIIVVLVVISVMYEADSGVSDGTCNVAVFPIEGVIMPFHGLENYELVTIPKEVENFMDKVEDDEMIKAVLVEINSPGGTPVASERIANRLYNSSLPIVALSGDMAASGGYMIAAATDHIVASPMSDIGSIGVNMSFVEESKRNEEEGLTYVQLVTGKYKDIGDPNRPVTAEEREILLADLQVIHDEFVNMVAEYRNMPTSTVTSLADGLSMPGRKALEVGLVDSLGGREEAKRVMAQIIDKDVADIHFCEYEAPLLFF